MIAGGRHYLQLLLQVGYQNNFNMCLNFLVVTLIKVLTINHLKINTHKLNSIFQPSFIQKANLTN